MNHIMLIALSFVAITALKQVSADDNPAIKEASILEAKSLEEPKDNPLEVKVLETYKISSQEWSEFQKHLTWLLETQKPAPAATDLDKISKDEKEIAAYFQRKREKSYNELITKVMVLQELFRIFQDRLSEVMELGAEGIHAYSRAADALLETTEWYISFMENNLFYPGWKSDYEAYSKANLDK